MENNNIEVLPPYTNRGVVNTLQSGLRACVDWLQVTFKNVQTVQQIIDVLGLDFDDFTEFENGKYGYHSHIRFGHIAIYYSSTLPHFHLEISGQGCREYEEFGNQYKNTTMLNTLVVFSAVRLSITYFKFSFFPLCFHLHFLSLIE